MDDRDLRRYARWTDVRLGRQLGKAVVELHRVSDALVPLLAAYDARRADRAERAGETQLYAESGGLVMDAVDAALIMLRRHLEGPETPLSEQVTPCSEQ